MRAKTAIPTAPLALAAAPFVVLGAMQIPSWLEYRRLRAEFEALELTPSKPTDEQIERGQSLLMIASRVERVDTGRRRDDELPAAFTNELPRIVALREFLLSPPPPALPPPRTGQGRAGYALDSLPRMLRGAAILHARAGDDAAALRDIEAAWRLAGCMGLDGRRPHDA